MPTETEVQALADAVWQLLDDMAKGGQSVCIAAKAEARIAYEPFRDKSDPEYDDWMSLEDAKAIVESLRDLDNSERKPRPSGRGAVTNLGLEPLADGVADLLIAAKRAKKSPRETKRLISAGVMVALMEARRSGLQAAIVALGFHDHEQARIVIGRVIEAEKEESAPSHR